MVFNNGSCPDLYMISDLHIRSDNAEGCDLHICPDLRTFADIASASHLRLIYRKQFLIPLQQHAVQALLHGSL